MVRKAEVDEPTVGKLSAKQDEKFLDSGIPALNELVGGIPIGRIVELWGSEGTGKSHLAVQIMANISQTKKVLYVDSEFSLNMERIVKLGVNPDNVSYLADSRLERVCELLVKSVGKYDLIILDSLAYLTPLTIDTNQVGETSIGLFARLIKHWVVKFRPRLGISKTAFIAVNQYRAPIGLYVKPEAPGGKAWGHAVDVRLYLTSNKADRFEGGHTLHLNVHKSKVSAPHQEAKIKILY